MIEPSLNLVIKMGRFASRPEYKGKQITCRLAIGRPVWDAQANGYREETSFFNVVVLNPKLIEQLLKTDLLQQVSGRVMVVGYDRTFRYNGSPERHEVIAEKIILLDKVSQAQVAVEMAQAMTTAMMAPAEDAF